MPTPIRLKHGQKLWMLRTSPHNEGFVHKVAHLEADLVDIAERYVRSIFDGVDWTDAVVDWTRGQLYLKFGLGDGEVHDQIFYITEVELL